MNQHQLPDVLFHEVWQLYEIGQSSEEIANRLKKRDIPEETTEEVCRIVLMNRFANRRKWGYL